MKRIQYLFILVFVLLVSSCNTSRAIEKGYFLTGQTIVPAFVGFRIDKNRYKFEDQIPIKFEYGHDVEDNKIELFSEFDFTLQVIINLYDEDKKVDEILYYEEELENFITNSENRIKKGGFIFFANVTYNRSFHLEFDFSQYDYHQGKLEYRMKINNNFEDLPEDERTQYDIQSIYFKQDGDDLVFTDTNPIDWR